MKKQKIYYAKLLVIGIWGLSCAFFWNDTEKNIEQLAKEAQQAFQNDRLLEARDLFQEALKQTVSDTGGKIIAWPLVIEYSMKLAHICELLGEPEEGVKVLTALLNRDLPSSLTPKILLMKARLSAPQSSPERSYLLLKMLAKDFPMERWSKEDLSFFHALSYALDEYFDSQLKRAKRYFVTGFYAEATALYEEVLTAIHQDSFPKAQLNPGLLEKKIQYALAECSFAQADYEKSLNYMTPTTEETSKIDREKLYLMALCYKNKQEYEKAIECFQFYTQSSEKEGLGHYDHALFEIGFYYYQHEQWGKARDYFETLQGLGNATKPKILGGLYLARILLKDKLFSEAETTLKRIYPLIHAQDPLRQEYFFLTAEVAYAQTDYAKAKECYELAAPHPKADTWRAEAYHKLGWCYLHIGCEPLLSLQSRETAFNHAEQMFTNLVDAHHSFAALSLARLYLLRKHWLKDMSAQERVESLLQTHHESFSLAEQHESLLLRATAATSMDKKEQLLKKAVDPSYSRLSSYLTALYEKSLLTLQMHLNHPCVDPASAEESLKTVIEMDPNGLYVNDALSLLGTLYFQKQDFQSAYCVFYTLAHHDHPLAAEGAFWAAEALYYLNPGDPLVLSLRQKVYMEHPKSDKAAEAYFRSYEYGDYANGTPDSLDHLSSFAERFPSSHLRIMVHYLLGLHKQERHEATACFETAVHLLPILTAEGQIPDANTLHFYYESLHKLALIYLQEESNREKGLDLLNQILSDFYEPLHPFMSVLKQQQTIPIEYAQAAYSLAKGYLDLKQRAKAEPILFRLLLEYREHGITDHLYLSLSWREQGKLALEDGDFETAKHCLDVAEESGNQSLTEEQKLRLWLLKSDCYRQIGDLEQAMRLLSKVINADVASPLRIQAMFARAEIYELQGRPELAMRQLEALVKKGGEWATEAQLRIRKLHPL